LPNNRFAGISTFPSTTTGTAVFSFHLLPFFSPSAAQHSGAPKNRPLTATAPQAKPTEREFCENQSRNPEKHPCFPRPDQPGDEYNQEEEKTALPTDRIVL
jgi:hypothetical protein